MSASLYDILGVQADASADDIRRAYRRSAVKHHPDKGGDPERFKEASAAYEVLSDTERRDEYDRETEPPQRGIGGSANVSVSLAEMYTGTTKTFLTSHLVPCAPCSGLGVRDGHRPPCCACNGCGVRTESLEAVSFRIVCADCSGTGFSLAPGAPCPACEGLGKVRAERSARVRIPAGARHGQRLQARCHAADGTAWAVVATIVQRRHAYFERSGDDLVYRKNLTLSEALCGYAFAVRHLDGRSLVLASEEGEIVAPGSVKAVFGEGMPRAGPGRAFGRLVVKLSVVFPKSGALGPEALRGLAALLPGGSKTAPEGKRVAAHAVEPENEEKTECVQQ